MEYYKEAYVNIRYEESVDLAVITWNSKFVTQQQYQKATEALLALVIEKNCTRCLCDTTHMGVMPLESQNWTNNVLIPKYVQSHLQYLAIVSSQDIFNKAAMSNIIRKSNNTHFTTTLFKERSEALYWLTSQKIHSTTI